MVRLVVELAPEEQVRFGPVQAHRTLLRVARCVRLALKRAAQLVPAGLAIALLRGFVRFAPGRHATFAREPVSVASTR